MKYHLIPTMLIALNPQEPNQPFPDASLALEEPNGLLAVGGCLSPRRLINAYRNGIFPWYAEDEPILWWTPNPRLVLFPEDLHVSRSFRKTLRSTDFSYSFDTHFEQVINACAKPRTYADQTWISPEIKRAYCRLHTLGTAHSFETWLNGKLVGGLYGVSIGRVFFGESMFHHASNASKAAFHFAVQRLTEWGFRLIDCQVYTDHLTSLGAQQIPRSVFLDLLSIYCEQPPSASAWQTGGTSQ